MGKIITLILILLPLAAGGEPAWPDSLLEAGLSALDLDREELCLFPKVNETDPFRIPWITENMQRPDQLGHFIGERLSPLESPGERRAARQVPDLAFLDHIAPLLLDLDFHEDGNRSPLLDSDYRIAPPPHERLAELMARASRERALALADLSPGEGAYLAENCTRVLDEADTAEIVDLFEMRRMEDAFAARSDSVISLWARLDRPLLLRCQTEFLRDALAYVEQLLRLNYAATVAPELKNMRFADGSEVRGHVHYATSNEYGNFVVGAVGPNTYEGNFAFILDLGGNDDYRLDSCRPGPGDPAKSLDAWRILWDLGGNDRYRARGDAALAGSVLGAACLIDEKGDDLYLARSFDLGAGWAGVGLLVDRAGQDYYSGDRCVMGAAGCGAGLLRDEGGEDVYRAHLYAQGFGFVGGLGQLFDLGGPDTYIANPFYLDVLRYEDHSLTLSQGFGFGWRPRWSGGVGLLTDLAGNDSYLADIYGQGTSYWYAMGLLSDHQGNDRYELWQYGQGAGIHLSLAALVDGGGNDSYAIHGVGQGCGHDLALGVLYDAGGNDRYSCDDLSQGAGNANGMGWLMDAGGLDGYLGKNTNAIGYGNRRRHFGSLGLCIDASGDDWRSVPVEPGALRGSFRGLALDLDGPVAGPAWTLADPLPYEESPRSWDEYFVMAAAGEPRFGQWKKAGHDSLMAHPGEAIPMLIEHFDTESARERHALKDLMREFGGAAVDPLREVLREGPPEYRRLAAWSLEHIRDRRAFPELMGILTDPRDERDLVSALAALAQLQNLSDGQKELLRRYGEELVLRPDTPVRVLKEIAYGLDRQGVGRARALIALAAHESYAVRWAAEEALSRRGGWGRELAEAWREADSADTLRRLAALLPYRPAREARARLREATGRDFGDDPALRRALRHALEAHPDNQGPVLRDLHTRWKGQP